MKSIVVLFVFVVGFVFGSVATASDIDPHGHKTLLQKGIVDKLNADRNYRRRETLHKRRNPAQNANEASAAEVDVADVDAAASLRENKWGCDGKTDDPHQSSTNPTQVNVHGWLKCPSELPQPEMLTEVTLFESVPWEWNPVARGVDHDFNTSRVEATANTPCRGKWIRYIALGYHQMIGRDDNYYGDPTASNPADVVC